MEVKNFSGGGGGKNFQKGGVWETFTKGLKMPTSKAKRRII